MPGGTAKNEQSAILAVSLSTPLNKRDMFATVRAKPRRRHRSAFAFTHPRTGEAQFLTSSDSSRYHSQQRIGGRKRSVSE